eukprot:TRINITY_DN7315_c0_g1_i1.p1 TRINITY_DN7315_c0_g1~~TRINITY_DN7315_c0_g1_i1.p1  ORF type:complete len:181 (+),score=50.73 TRINITY_DN7315_c0_g1_i1:59-601(+)
MNNSFNNENDEYYSAASPSAEKKRKVMKLFPSHRKSMTISLSDLTNITSSPRSPYNGDTPTKSSSKSGVSSSSKVSKKSMAAQIEKLEQQLQLQQQEYVSIQELRLQLAKTKQALEQCLSDKMKLNDHIEDLMTVNAKLSHENKRLRSDLDIHVTKKWRDFCSESSGTSRKRSYSSVEAE